MAYPRSLQDADPSKYANNISTHEVDLGGSGFDIGIIGLQCFGRAFRMCVVYPTNPNRSIGIILNSSACRQVSQNFLDDTVIPPKGHTSAKLRRM